MTLNYRSEPDALSRHFAWVDARGERAFARTAASDGEERGRAGPMSENPPNSQVFAAIGAVLSDYLDGLHFCDLARLEAVFHPRAVYATADEAPPLIRSMEEYFAVIAKRQSPASRGETRRDHVDSIELAGENTAFSRVRCTIGDRDFVDLLTLIRVDGRWRIISKIFQMVEAPQREEKT